MRIRTFLKLLLPWIIGYLLIVGCVKIVTLPYFTIKKVMWSVAPTSASSTLATLQQESQQSLSGSSLWLFPKRYLKRYLEQDIAISHVTIRRRFPQTLEIKITPKIPVGMVFYGSNPTTYVVDSAGTLMGTPSDFSNLILVKYHVSDRVELKKAMAVTLKIPKAYQSQLTSVNASPGEIDLVFSSGFFLKTTESVKDEKYDIAMKLYEKLISQGSLVDYIDIRFKNYAVKEN